MHKTVNFGSQNSDVDGFGDVATHPCAEKLLGIAGHSVRSHGYDGCVRPTLLPNANSVSCINAAKHGHLDVHQD